MGDSAVGFLGGGRLEPAVRANLPTAFRAERTSSFTVWTKPFDFLLARLRDAGLEGGIGMLTSFVMMFSTLTRELDGFFLTAFFALAVAALSFVGMGGRLRMLHC